MKKVAITMASDYKYMHKEDMPEEVYDYFMKLKKKYKLNNFIVNLAPFEDHHSDIEVMVYDDYVE